MTKINKYFAFTIFYFIATYFTSEINSGKTKLSIDVTFLIIFSFFTSVAWTLKNKVQINDETKIKTTALHLGSKITADIFFISIFSNISTAFQYLPTLLISYIAIGGFLVLIAIHIANKVTIRFNPDI